MKKLALHTCCAPCSTVFLPELLEEGRMQPVVVYVNDNMDTAEEFDKRLAVVRAYCESLGVQCAAKPYEPELFEEATRGLGGVFPLIEDDPHYQRNLEARHKRCGACYDLRLSLTAQFAKHFGIKVLGTTLAVSPYQFVDEINATLVDVAKAYRLQAAPIDMRDRYRESIARSRGLHIYRQNYCGCRWSKLEAEAERQARKEKKKEHADH
jgi:predicted adenine nucleotide alpha hydrolase (AANH) superfamily ATPase